MRLKGIRFATTFGVVVVATLILGACASPTPAPTIKASPTVIPTIPAIPVPAPASPSPTPVTFDGLWAGTTSDGQDFSFSISGHKINDIELPAAKCGAGMASTISQEGGFKFSGSTFRATTIGLFYTSYPKTGGPGISMHDYAIIKGSFSSSTSAKGTITTKVQSDQGTIDQCQARWTATKG